MKREMKKVVTIVLAVVTVLAMTGCALLNPFKADKYVVACLDALYKGEVTEYAKMVDITEKEALADYEDGIKDTLAQETAGVTLTEDQKTRYTEIVKEMHKLTSYEVVKSEKDGSGFVVTVSVKPATVYEVIFAKVTEASESAQFTDASEYVEFYITASKEAILENEYLDAVEIKVKVAKDSSGVYVMNASDQEKLETALFDLSSY